MNKPGNGSSFFKFISSIFHKYGVSPILAGGYAVIIYGVRRATYDIDFLITAEDCNKIEPELIRSGFSVLNRQMSFLQLKSNKPGLRDIDFLIVDNSTMAKIAADSKKVTIGGGTFTAPSVKHLIAMKVHSISQNKERELTDFPDIYMLLKENDISPYTNDIVSIFNAYKGKGLYKRLIKLWGKDEKE